jgi:hypothetical protein
MRVEERRYTHAKQHDRPEDKAADETNSFFFGRNGHPRRGEKGVDSAYALNMPY